MKRARQKWNSIARILKREGANAKTMAKFYLAIVQAVLLYGADSWTITKKNLIQLRSFHHRAVRYMTGKHIRKIGENEWEYPDHGYLLEKCQLFPIDTYIERRRGTLRKYLEENRKELFENAKQTKLSARNPHKVLWWKQRWIEKSEMNELKNFWKK